MATMTPEQADIVSLYGVPGIGTKLFARLVAIFGSAGNVFAAAKRDLMAVEGIGKVLYGNISSFDREGFIGGQERMMKESGACILTRSDAGYPPLLNVFPSAPPVLFVRGDVTALKKASIAFVGTRRPSMYGLKMTRTMAAEAVAAGYCVVSGMAEGIDTAAHRAALEAGGTTVAVFGCGVDVIYPTSNRGLARDITGAGCLVSHFPMGTMGTPGNFPARNSVIVGLSIGTVVTEAPIKSGALITADLTMRAGRPLFSAPGPIDSPTSAGTNNLLGLGAHPATSFDDILAGLGKKNVRRQPAAPIRPAPDGFPGEVLKTLDNGPLYIEKICALLNHPVPEVLSVLTVLELDGNVVQRPGKIFERR